MRQIRQWSSIRLPRLLTSRGRPLAVLALLISLLVTGWGWYQTREQVWHEAELLFQSRVNDLLTAIEQRMAAYEQVLRGGVAFLSASESVSRDDWRTYVSQLQLQKNYPGMLGTGYTVYLRPHQVAELERQVRASGFPDFEVWPKGERPVYTAILYLEPFDWRNRRAFGYDMYSQPTRRAAMIKARDEGQPAVTGKVVLVQETPEDSQSGFLMYLPVYQGGEVPPTVNERREKLIGFVYSPFRMNDLMAGIIGGSLSDLLMRIYDGASLRRTALMYESAEQLPSSPAFEAVHGIEINGHPWTIYFASLPAMEEALLASSRPTFVLVTGLLLSGLLFALLWTIAGTEARAAAIAKTMTEAFQQSEAKFAALVQAATDAIIITDSEGRIVSWNHGATEMFGYQEEAVIGRSWDRILPPRLRQQYDRGRRIAISGHGPLLRRVLALSAVRENGEEFPVEVSLARWGVGDETFLSAIIRDVSEREKVQQALRLSEARFRAVFENAAIGVMLTDLDGRILEANPALGKMLGYEPAELRDLEQNMLVHPEDRIATHQLTQALKENQQPFVKQQKRYLRRDGSVVWGSLTASLIRDDQGQPRFLLRLIEDVTELRAAQEALSQAYHELEQRVEARTRELRLQTEELARSNAELEQFAYVASHDLQEPLRSISGFAQLLERRYKHLLGEEGQAFVGYIVSGTDRMRALITDLLSYSRAGMGEKPRVPVDMEAVLDQALDSLVGSIREKRVVIVRDPLPVVWGDPVGFEHLLQNLIGNALKFNRSLSPRVEISARDNGEEWLFVVRDNGIGIEPEFLPRLFTIFQCGRRRSDYAGTGIGLAICKKVVESHHGRIWAESTPGEGTTFYFTLPKVQEDAPGAEAGDASERAPASRQSS
ncbi:MAG: PAS domain S-box protein [Xanthomonadaceae bacterium]|nr:PAS domain S-box protein [Xanthomonadaceae bacterium]